MGEEQQTLRVWVDRCQTLPRRRTSWSSNNYSVKVYELPPGTESPIYARLAFPVHYIYGSGTQDDAGTITFPEHLRKRSTEVVVHPGYRLRFEVMRHLKRRNKNYVLGFAEIEVEELIRHNIWKLLLSDPVSHEALYGGDRTTNIRIPSFLIIRTRCLAYCIDDSMAGISVSPTVRSVTEQRPARQRLSTSGSRRMGRVKVLVITRGTRGDVQPFVALARGLAQPPYNCDVTICTEIIWKKFVKSAGKDLPEGSITFRPAGGNTMRKMGGAAAQWVLRNGQSYDTLQAIMLSRSEVEFFPSEGMFYHYAEEERPDFIVFGLTCTHVAMIISEALQIPIVGFLLQPTSEIQARSAPLTATDQALDPLRKMVSGPQFNAVIKQIMEHVGAGITLNDLRLSRGLFKAPRDIREYAVHYQILKDQDVPLLTPISPLVKGTKASYLPGLTFTDFIFLRMGGADKLDDEISGFVSRAKSMGRPLVLITFSSMPIGERKLLKLATSICTYCVPQFDNGSGNTKRPAVIAMAAGQDHDPAPTDLLADVDKLSKEERLLVLRRGAPFGALFPLLDALVLHGGLGVTSEAFYAGLPVVTCGILVMDQRYWAARCDEIGCGCEGVPINQAVAPIRPDDQTSPPRIVELLNKALDKRTSPNGNPTWTKKAQELQKQLMPDPTKDDGGISKNADEVYRCGLEYPRVVQDAYIDQQGCLCAFFRQQKCCCKCWCHCVRWCVCSQSPRLVMLLLVCLAWVFCCPFRCIWRCLCYRKKYADELEDDFDFDLATPMGAEALTTNAVKCFRERAQTQVSNGRSSWGDPTLDPTGCGYSRDRSYSIEDLELGVAEEERIQDVVPSKVVRPGLPSKYMCIVPSTGN